MGLIQWKTRCLSKAKSTIEFLTIIKGAWEMFSFFSDIKKRLAALEAKIELVWQHLFKGTENAKQDGEATEDHGSGSAQPAVRQEDGNPTEGSEGVQQG